MALDSLTEGIDQPQRKANFSPNGNAQSGTHGTQLEREPMRSAFVVLALFLVNGLSRGDVTILNNLSGFGSTTAITSSGNVVFTVPALYSGTMLSKFSLRINNTSGTVGNTLTGASLQFSFNGGGASTINADAFTAINGGSSGDVTFDISSLSYAMVNPGNNTLSWTSLAFTGAGTAAYHISNAGFGGVGTFVSASPNPGSPNNIQFSLTAVPEPGTMLLGGMLATGSGAGFWWRRRRKGVESA